jgi:hypothetical protein
VNLIPTIGGSSAVDRASADRGRAEVRVDRPAGW